MNLNPQSVFNAVAEEYNVTADQIKGSSRKRPLPEVRQMICYILRDLPTPVIATLINRHRTIPFYSIDKMHQLMDVYKDVQEKHNNILKAINLQG